MKVAGGFNFVFIKVESLEIPRYLRERYFVIVASVQLLLMGENEQIGAVFLTFQEAFAER